MRLFLKHLAPPCCLLVLAAWIADRPAAQDSSTPPVRAGTDSGVELRSPPERDGFSFAVFGDRTTGKPSGLHLLDEGVRMANRLDVDFAMTVGDLVQGYNQASEWLQQMSEYKLAMSKLACPWYPVVGNHDVYAADRAPGGHIDLYKQYVGPLYYSFDHRWAHFVCLFSDESLSFDNPPVDQNLSDEQFEWLRADLAATQASQVFVFLHHPRWTYQGTNWPKVHELLVRDGRTAAVIAGHLHHYRDDGSRDGIHYYTMAMTGASKETLKETAAMQHLGHVNVRRTGFTLSVLPVGTVLASDVILGSEVDAMMALLRASWLDREGQLWMRVREGERSTVKLAISNPSEVPLPWRIEIEASQGWSFEPSSAKGSLAPGAVAEITFAATAPGLDGSRPDVAARAVLEFQLVSGMKQPIETRLALPVGVRGAVELASAPADKNKRLVLDGKSAVRVDIDPTPDQFTLECWVRGPPPHGRTALLNKTESSGFGIFWCDEGGSRRLLPFADVGLERRPDTQKAGYLTLTAREAWDWTKWTHVALCWDGRRARFFVNGKLHDEALGSGPTSRNRHPLYIGADPGGDGAPGSFFTGAIDEVRLSRVARYEGEFTPAERFESDADAVLLFHFDAALGGLHPDASPAGNHGWAVGEPKLVEDRH